MHQFLDRFFQLRAANTSVRKELLAGLTTFVTMAYIIFVNPSILALAGMDMGAVFVATILSAAIGTLVMGLYANVPFALAPGMGMNAFFTFAVVLTMKLTWQQALAIVFICGIINIVITATSIRKMLIMAIPKSLQHAIGAGIGLFITYIGIKNAHFISFVTTGNDVVRANVQNGNVLEVVAKDVLPSLARFTDPVSLVALTGLVIMVVLLLRNVQGGILLGIGLTTIVGIFMGVTTVPSLTATSFLPPSILPTFFQLDLTGLFAQPGRLFAILAVILGFSLADTFDTIGTFLGTGAKSGIFDASDEALFYGGAGFSSKLDRALFADATATSMGALLGTSNVTTYIESVAGISAGGKTGLTSVFTAIFFLLSLFLAPFALMIPPAATAPALIVVGIFMMASITKIRWDDFDEAAPAFLTLVVMPFTYSIANGVAAGFIFYVLTRIAGGRAREVHPLMYTVTLLFILNFVFEAL